MNSKILTTIIAIFIIIFSIISVGAETDLTNTEINQNSEEEISIEQIENTEGETASDFIDYISEDNNIEGERIESITPEEVTSEKMGAEPGQEEVTSSLEEAPISSQTQEQGSVLEENVEYIPLGEVSDETSPSLNQEENLTENEIEDQNSFFNQSQNQTNIGSGQMQSGEEKEVKNTGLNETNQTTLPNETLEEDHTDVRGNTQTGTEEQIIEILSSVPTPSSTVSVNEEYLMDIDDLSIVQNKENNESNNETRENTEETNEIVITLLQSEDREKIVEQTNIGDIKYMKETLEENKFSKRVKVYSEEHVDIPITVESMLPQEVLKKQIKIFWENNGNLEITNLEDYNVKYYDENDNGLVEKISWIVPHLSDQFFQIIIEPDFIEDPGKNDHIDIVDTGLPYGQISNPINFSFEIRYINITNVSCLLDIKDSSNFLVETRTFNISANGTNIGGEPIELDDGSYSWKISCVDLVNTSITSSPHKSGTFTIDEGFEIKNLNDFYFLDLVDDSIKNPGSGLEFYSKNPATKNYIIKKEGNVHYAGTGGSLALDSGILNSSGNYEIIVNFLGQTLSNATLNKSFSVVGANITFTPGTYKVGEDIPISFRVDSFGETINYVIFRFGDDEDELINVAGNTINRNYLHSYDSTGDYDVSLEITISGHTGVLTIDKSGITIESSEDTEDPEIDLIYPSYDATINNDSITFNYEASDNIKVENCTFRLYNETNDEELSNVRRTWDDIQNEEEIEYKVIDFDQGDYVWEVECFDNSSNREYDFNPFQINFGSYSSSGSAASASNQFTDYELREEVETMIEIVNDYLENEDDLTSEVKEIYEDLGIKENIDYYKKRLLQIDQYFKENYKYVDTESLREQKNEEYTEEFENIQNSVPSEIKVIEEYEYVKNSVEIDLREVVEDYMESTNTKISNGFAKKLANMNSKLQQEISVEANIKRVKITYENHTDEFTLVKKKIDLKDESYDQILEIIPKSIIESASQVDFLVDNQIIKDDPIFEILYDDLTDNNEILYYIETDIDLKDFTKTETILFEESFNEVKVGVTGFFGGGFISGTNPIYFALILLLAIVLIVLFLFVFGRYRRQNWKKEPNVVKCFELLRKTNLYLKEKDIERARESYREMKRIYPALPPKPKQYFYDKIKDLSIRIDRRDIFGLVREYEEAKKGFNKEDCLRIYGEIKKVYERLPLKDRQKIYERISK